MKRFSTILTLHKTHANGLSSLEKLKAQHQRSILQDCCSRILLHSSQDSGGTMGQAPGHGNSPTVQNGMPEYPSGKQKDPSYTNTGGCIPSLKTQTSYQRSFLEELSMFSSALRWL